MPGSASGLYVNGVLSHPSWNPSFRPAKRARTNRSVFNSTDDWDELVASSQLSTASVSTRPARPRGLQTLAVCAEHAAVRNFKRLYEEGKVRVEGKPAEKGWWETEWEEVPDHLKLRVREGVYKRYGGVLKLDVIRDLFIIAPHLDFPGDLVPALATATTPKALHPPKHIAGSITSLRLRHCPQMTDAAVSGLISVLPNLELLNLKGCSLVAGKTVDALVKRCPKLKGFNLKQTKIREAELKLLLDAFGGQLERLKVDGVTSRNVEELFALSTYPKITHLCIPAYFLDGAGKRNKVPSTAQSDRDVPFDWAHFSQIFSSVTHLYPFHPDIPVNTVANIAPNTLQKLALNLGGSPVPVDFITGIVNSQTASLNSVHLGHVEGQRGPGRGFDKLGVAFKKCTKMEDFRWACEGKSSQDMQRYSVEAYGEAMGGPWQSTLKHLHFSLPQRFYPNVLIIEPCEAEEGVGSSSVPPLESLSLPGASIEGTPRLALYIAKYRNLRSLDLSGTAITTEEVYMILDGCPLLSRIDLTSCRGVSVRLRRGIFEAWEEDRRDKSGDAVEAEGGGGSTRRPKRLRG